jgi:hypothetical protein
MPVVTRLVTLVDFGDQGADASQMSVSARHEAELADGRRVLLLDDRGWTSTAMVAYPVGEVPDSEDQPDIWDMTSIEDIEESARVVVGPDEAFGEHSQEDMEASHWAYLAEVLREQGVEVDALELRRLPHDVVLSERLRARIGPDRGSTPG